MSLLRSPGLIGRAKYLIAGVLIGAFTITCWQQDTKSTARAPSVRDALGPQIAFAAPAQLDQGSIADVAERVVASVVNISAEKTVQQQPGLPGHPGLGQGHGHGDMFHFFGPQGRQPGERKQQGLGSGVVVSDDGVILTNNHVVEHADKIQVTLSDGREFAAAIVGTDPKSDLAVLRLDGQPSGLTPLPIGDSSALRLGQVVLAVGNPFGVGQTVTMGIVSAKGRSRVGIVDYEDFIQTDAAINPGNSGGALVDMNGHLVGINTAILSRSGGYQGIGFAIPTDMAQPIMDSLLRDGKVTRGWLGVAIQDLDEALAKGLGIPVQKGVLISDVNPGSPAAAAGLERSDVVLEFDGEPVHTTTELRNRVATAGPDAKVELLVVRAGKRQTLAVTLGELKDGKVATANPTKQSGSLSGLHVAPLDPRARSRYQIDGQVSQGVVVTTLAPGSVAQRAGMRVGDVIQQVNQQPIDSVAAFNKALADASGPVVLLVSRNGRTVFISLRPE